MIKLAGQFYRFLHLLWVPQHLVPQPWPSHRPNHLSLFGCGLFGLELATGYGSSNSARHLDHTLMRERAGCPGGPHLCWRPVFWLAADGVAIVASAVGSSAAVCGSASRRYHCGRCFDSWRGDAAGPADGNRCLVWPQCGPQRQLKRLATTADTTGAFALPSSSVAGAGRLTARMR
jgi:hypothetical protein